MKKSIYKKYSRPDQRAMAVWAAGCAQRVLRFFEKEFPGDGRPRHAIRACRRWVRTGVFKMADIRSASLGSHAAARNAEENSPAFFAARAAGQAVGTAHVTQHAYGAAYYALKAVAAAAGANAQVKVVRERDWQESHLPAKLRRQIMKRIVVAANSRGTLEIKLKKSRGF
jgi:hypothetical protein